MKNSIKKLMFVVLLIGTSCVYGQTPYQNKVTEIKAKYLIKFGMPAQEAEMIKKKGDFVIQMGLNQQMKKYSLLNGDAALLALIIDMGKELKQAEKLKTAAELNKEKEIEKAKKQRKDEEAALIRERGTDLYQIKEKTKEAFVKWVTRGEFEKKADYEERMLKKEDMLKTLFLQELYTHIEQKRDIGVKLVEYNADNELYKIIIYTTTDDDFSFEASAKKMTATINVSPNIAQEMKQNENDIEVLDTMLVQDNDIFFSKIQFKDVVYDLNIDNSYTDIENFKISTNELGLSEYFTENKDIELF